MGKINIQSIQFEGYKSFPCGVSYEIDATPYVSVLIGKNNSGKSSCIDVIESVFDPGFYISTNNLFSRVSLVFLLDSERIRYGFSTNVAGGDVPSSIHSNHYSYGSQFIGKKIITDLSLCSSPQEKSVELVLSKQQPDINPTEAANEWRVIPRRYNGYQIQYAFRRINADRDVVPEAETMNEEVEFGGTGATNIIRKFINHSLYDEKLIEELLLIELNKIMEPDAHFQSIRVQQIGEGDSLKWEVFLEESNGNRFALSKSGSGLKTILLMLINLYTLPKTQKYEGREIVFAFEELENNLHPALQRRVFEYIYDYAVNKKAHVYITTHSHIAINTYFEKENTALYHVQKVDGISSLTQVKDRFSRMDVLNDLAVHASDLFQSNGIIWVEGPSDRIYINRWLKVFCNNQYIEGAHYQFLYYGGKNLAHFTAEEELDEFISIVKTNQNAAIVIDSDKRHSNDRINSTKARIRKEFEAINGFCWITKGKEVENYIATSALTERYATALPELGCYDLFPEYIKKQEKNFSTKKVAFAKEVVEYITAENSEEILDLKKQIEKLYALIIKWNR